MRSSKIPSEKNLFKKDNFNVPASPVSRKDTLREKAEEVFELQESKPISESTRITKAPVNLSEAEAQRLIYELEVHQLELEMQNNELLQAKNQLEVSVEKYFELYDFSPAAYFTLNRDGEILDLNLFGSKMLGKERLNLTNSRFGFFVSDETKPEFNSFLETIFTFNTEASCHITLNPEGGNQPMYVHLSGIVKNGYEKCLIAATDISESIKIEKELELKNKELQRANIEKDKFFSIIAHDLRGPFNGILGLTEMMAESLEDMDMQEIKKVVLIMKKSATNLNHLLGNLLEWSRIQRGLLPFLPWTFVLKPSILENMGILIESAKEKNIEIGFEIPEDLEIYADKNILESVVRNLVSNAVKFTPHGGKITVSAKMGPDKSVELSFKDTGIGMANTILDNLFKLDSNTGRRGTAGELSTGLGLIISKDLIEKHEGKIWIESEVGKGSNACFTLPAQKCNKHL